MMTLEQLPPKGVKREQAILELGKEEANGELLFQLVNTEKGKCKTAAQKALAQLEYAPAAPCGPNWSRANGWAAISCRIPVPTVYRSRSPRSS